MRNDIITLLDLGNVSFRSACELRRLGWISDEVWQPYMTLFNESDKSWWQVDFNGNDSVKKIKSSWQFNTAVYVWIFSFLFLIPAMFNPIWFAGFFIPLIFTPIMIWSRWHK
jgi:hypothetical protein